MKNFPALCEECFHPSDAFLGPADSCSHKEGCSKIGSDPRHDLWLENSREAGMLPHHLLTADTRRTVKEPVKAPEIAEAMRLYLSSRACMLLFSKLTLYRAMGESPQLRVSYRGMLFRVSLVRSTGEVEHFNRDGLE